MLVSEGKHQTLSPLNLEGPLRIVSIGGGTGLSTLLRGLKKYANAKEASPLVEITAIVTVTDDGGSSGRLRKEFAVIAPGDIRNCMVALSEDEALLSKLFQYRFDSGRGLRGHSFGNLFLTALTNLTGDFARAVQLSGDVLAISGKIYPSTSSNVVLEAELDNGRIVRGETRISKSRVRIKKISLSPANCKPLPETLEAIAKAGYTPGKDIYLGLDCASSEFYKNGQYVLGSENKSMTSAEFAQKIDKTLPLPWGP